jgi:hypothetical protein
VVLHDEAKVMTSCTPDLLIKRSATFGGNGELRFTLTREWDDRPKVCFIGHNPSTADHLVDDPTVRRWMYFARAWGRGGFVAVNLYPIRTPDADKAWRWADYEHNGPDWWARDMLMLNVETIAREAKACGLVVACWGAIARDPVWNDHVIEEIVSGEGPWPTVHVFRLTAAGAPVHPMARGRHRVPDDAQPIIWQPGCRDDADG